MKLLHVLIPQNEHSFYTLYVFGSYGSRHDVAGGTDFEFPTASLLVLYYTYPAHRRAYVVRFTDDGTTVLPGLSAPVKKIICVYASKVDKLKKALSYIGEHYFSPLKLSDLFYIRLERLLLRKGKLDYAALKNLCETYKQETI